MFKMDNLGEAIRKLREEKELPLRTVAAFLDIDQAILSKIERNKRKPTKDNLSKLSQILKLDKDELMIQFMSDKIAYEIADQDCATKVLKVAEKKIKYYRLAKAIQNNLKLK